MEIKLFTARTFGGMHNDQRVGFIFKVADDFCIRCQALNVDTLSPADRDGCATGAFLCGPCSMFVPSLDFPAHLRITWPMGIKQVDIAELWAEGLLKKAKKFRAIPTSEVARASAEGYEVRECQECAF